MNGHLSSLVITKVHVAQQMIVAVTTKISPVRRHACVLQIVREDFVDALVLHGVKCAGTMKDAIAFGSTENATRTFA